MALGGFTLTFGRSILTFGLDAEDRLRTIGDEQGDGCLINFG